MPKTVMSSRDARSSIILVMAFWVVGVWISVPRAAAPSAVARPHLENASVPFRPWYELRRSFSRALFCCSLQRLVPEIQSDDLATGGSGVRAQAISPEGDLVQDFSFIARPNALHVLNAPSPAATASLAIGAEITDMAAKATAQAG